MNFFRKLAGGIGDVAKIVAPGLVFIPGVGPVAAAAVGAAGGAMGTLNDKQGTNPGRALKNALGYGAGTYAGTRMMGAGSGGKLNPGAALQNLLDSGGGAVDWLTDKDHPSRAALTLGGVQAGLGFLGGRAADRQEADQIAYGRERNERYDPMREKLMQMFMDRFPAGRP